MSTTAAPGGPETQASPAAAPAAAAPATTASPADKTADEKKAALRAAAAERRKQLAARGPEFLEEMKRGQVFTEVTETGCRDVFVWFVQEPGRSGALNWEPAAATPAEQKMQVDESRQLRFSVISDIFMGRTNAIFQLHADKINIKNCISFVAHKGHPIPSLNLCAKNPQLLEVWIYGIQHTLKQGGFHFLEANEMADKREAEIFAKYSAKQLIRLIMQKDAEVMSLRLKATLNKMNRGQVGKDRGSLPPPPRPRKTVGNDDNE